MDYAKKAARRTAIVFIVSIMAAFFGFLIRIILARGLSPEEYGLFFSIFTLISLLALFRRAGLLQALVKFIPEFQVKKKPELIKNAILIVLITNLILAIIISIILAISSNFLANNYFGHDLSLPVLLLFSIIFVAGVFKMTLRYIFNAFQKMDKFSLMYLAENVLILVFILLFFYFRVFSESSKIFSPVFAYLITYILLFFIFLPCFLKMYPFFKYKFKFSKKLNKKLINFGIPVMIGGLGSIIILYTDTLILTYFTNLKEVGIYNVIVPTVMLLDFFGKAINQVIFPMVSELWAKNLKSYIIKGAKLLQKYAFVIVTPIALIMFSFPELIINVLFGKEYISGAFTMQLLVIGIIFFVTAGINMELLKGIGQPITSTKIILIGAIFNLITNFYFIPRYGIMGAGITSLVSYFLILIISIFYLRKFIKLKVNWINWIKILFSGIIFALIIYLLKISINTTVYVEAFLCVSVATIIYLLLIFILKVTNMEEIRDLFLNKT